MKLESKAAMLTPRACLGASHGGFTMTELLVVLATTSLLVALVLPTLGFSKAKSQVANCLMNFNHLTKACAMYTENNQGLYPPNPDDGGVAPGYDWCQGDASGWSIVAAGGSASAGNATYLTSPSSCSLAPFLGGSATPFKCPADWRVCLYGGKIVPVVRSVSANGGVGTVDAAWLSGGSHSGRPSLPVPGSWLTGNHSEIASQYATFGKSTSFKNCRPSEIWIYGDEDPLSINDACMGVVAATPEVVDYPSTRHQNAGGFGFCDGHAEMHRWKSNLFLITGLPNLRPAAAGVQRQDWFWFAWHASRSSITGTVP